LIRPHPQNAEQWRLEDLSAIPNAVVWPRAGANPIDSNSRNDYFHSLKFSAGIVGINTSALIEAAIVSKPVFTIKDAEFATTQDGTLHFHHLTSVNGGLLHVATDFDQHLAQVANALAEPSQMSKKSRAFVESFVRPFGLESASVDRFVAAVERMEKAEPLRDISIAASALRPLLAAWQWQIARSARAGGKRKRISEQRSEGQA
jgi:hypothetical protein